MQSRVRQATSEDAFVCKTSYADTTKNQGIRDNDGINETQERPENPEDIER